MQDKNILLFIVIFYSIDILDKNKYLQFTLFSD